MKDYGRYHKKRKENIYKGWLLTTGKDVTKGKHDAWIGALEGVTGQVDSWTPFSSIFPRLTKCKDIYRENTVAALKSAIVRSEMKTKAGKSGLIYSS